MISIVNAIVKEIIEETPSVKTIVIQPEQKIDFVPGQFINLIVEHEGKKIIRPYSLASTPDNENIELMIKILPDGRMSEFIDKHLKVNSKVKIHGPFGEFNIEDSKNYLFIGAGSGLAPLMSMLRYSKDNNCEKILVYSDKTPDEIIYKKELEELNSKENIKVVLTVTRDETWEGNKGRISKELLQPLIKENQIAYICGSPEFVNNIIKILEELGLNSENIRVEKY